MIFIFIRKYWGDFIMINDMVNLMLIYCTGFIGPKNFVIFARITPRKSDVIPDPTAKGSLTLQQRGQRTSFTFRAVRHSPCNCSK